MNEAATRRAPTVAGVAGGVGTTTIARALAGSDRGVFIGRPVDVLVCRATADSLVRAARAAYLISTQQHRRPVLAVNTADAAGPSRPSVARMRLLEPHTAGVIVLPYVRRWRDLATPLQDVTGLLGRPLGELPGLTPGIPHRARPPWHGRDRRDRRRRRLRRADCADGDDGGDGGHHGPSWKAPTISVATEARPSPARTHADPTRPS